MANNRDLINAFDDCVERLSTGEDLGDILNDYPESVDYLRDLLMISEAVSQVHSEDDESLSAQSRGRQKLQQALKEKPKRKVAGRPRWYMMAVAAASFMLVISIGLLITSLFDTRSSTLNIQRTSVAQANTTTESLIRETQTQSGFYLQATQDVEGVTSTPSPFVENFDFTATALVDPQSIIPTSVASMEEATVPPPMVGTGDAPYLTLTTVANDPNLSAQLTADPLNELFEVTPTAEFGEISPLDGAQMTATALADLFMQTPSATRDMIEITPYTGDGPSLGGGAGGGSDVDNAIKVTSLPPPPGTPTLTGTPTPAPSQTVAPQGTRVADGSLIIPSQVDSVDATPLPALMPLTAGEIDDNADWDTYLLYRREFMARGYAVHDIDVTGRQIIHVVDETGQPVLGADVIVFTEDKAIAISRTYADGRTLFFPNINEESRNVDVFRVLVKKGDIQEQFTLERNQQTEWQVTLPLTVNRNEVQVDVLFLMDTTSSMSDEIMQLQNNILHISSEVDALADNISVNYGLLLYREHNNFEYLTRRHDFTGDVVQFQSYLNAVTANSGDNNPDWDEALNVGLDEAIHQMTWRDENTIKLVFLVADARPHINHSLEPITYDQSIQEAMARGIKIHPIASSGLEPDGEFIFRQIAQVTMGHFVFLTYGEAGSGTTGDTRPEFNVGDPNTVDPIGGYSVDRLDDLVLRLIQDEIQVYQGTRQP